uniref:Putative methyltransferase n=1 Tax=viral metagenome TaxID=1070528 RepID=A0A6M3XY87_9ZZZZ
MEDRRLFEQDDVSSYSWVKINLAGTDNTITKQRALLTKQYIVKPALDVGCNIGGYTIFCECQVGLDFVKKHLVKAKVDCDRIDWVCGCAECLPFKDKTFETVIMTEIIEHVENPDVLLREGCRVGERIILTTPLDYVDAMGHVRLYTVDLLLEQLFKYVKVTVLKILREKNNIRMAFIVGECNV